MPLATHDIAATAAHLLATDLLRESARALHAEGIPVMPLKGLWLQHFAYDAPGERFISDVDVLVRPRDYRRAEAVLRGIGYHPRLREVEEVALESPRHPLLLDLHRELFTREAFLLRADDVMDRGHDDAGRLGVPLRMPDPLDVLAHLVGHFVKSHGTREDLQHLRDFQRFGTKLGCDPASAAAHLRRCGLGRAARYTLGLSVEVLDDDFSRAVLRALPSDPLGDLLAIMARVSVSGEPRHGGAGALFGFALDRSLPAGFRAAVARMRARSGRPG